MFSNKEGEAVPQTTFRTRDQHEWQEVTSDDIFKGKNVVVFSLPGAFTPTCSASHVPRYNQLADELFSYGIDEIVCISVNDAFVMQQWQEDQQAWNIRFIPDGNSEFTEKMGMLVGKEDLGFGQRSWRYSMLVKDGVISKMFIENEEPGDPYSVSDADTMLKHIAPNAPKPLDATIFTRKGCGHCVRAKQALEHAGIAFEELKLNQDFTDRTLRAVAAATSFPQIFINGEHIGGADSLEHWLKGRRAA